MRSAGGNVGGSRSASGLKTITALSLLVLGFLAGLLGLNFLVPLQSSSSLCTTTTTTTIGAAGSLLLAMEDSQVGGSIDVCMWYRNADM